MAAPGRGATAAPLPDFDYSQVDGVKVESRAPAKILLHNPQSGKKESRALDGIDEVLLADGRVLFQCCHRPNGCGRTWDSARSVMSHLKVHIGRAAVKRAEDRVAELEEQLAAAERQVTSLTGMKERRDAKIMALQADLRLQASRHATAFAELQAAVVSAQDTGDPITRAAYNEAMSKLDKRSNELIGQLRELFADVGGLLVHAGPPDAELLDKAQKWDEMSKLLGR